MPDFSKILFVSDYDHTMTGRDGAVPPCNREAVEWFIAHGGHFTLCTGRSFALFRPALETVTVNAPVLLFNGACCYDFSSDTVLFQHEIELDAPTLIRELSEAFPDLLLELQGMHAHGTFRYDANLHEFYRRSQCPYELLTPAQIPPRVMKLALYGEFRAPNVTQLFDATDAERAYFEAVTDEIQRRYGHAISAVRPAVRIVDLQSKHATKGLAVRQLAERLGVEVLAAAGDSDNDVSMLRAADYAFVPTDAPIPKEGFRVVAPCSEGSLRDAIDFLAGKF